MMRIYFQLLFFVFTLLSITSVHAATEINGTVTAKRGESVQVTFEPNETAGPKIGDAVSFSKEIPGTGGIKAKAGEGTVTEVDGSTVWVKTSDNRPNLKMDAVIQATGDPLPREYSLELPGQEFRTRGDVSWHPNGIFRFNSSAPLSVDSSSFFTITFPEGAYFSPPHPLPAFEETLKAGQLEYLKRKIEISTQASDDWQTFCDIVWSGREVKGRNAFFLVSQFIETKRYFKDRKILSEEKKQEFLISFELPMPPQDSRTFMKYYWHIAFSVPSRVADQYHPEYWEKIVLDILQSASVDLRGGKLEVL